MMKQHKEKNWVPGSASISVVMLSLNEAHNMEAVCQNLSGWAKEVFLVDSFSQDETLDIALKYGVQVVQRKFKGFGDQWNFALQKLPIQTSWTMKLDPDERLSDELKENILKVIQENTCEGIEIERRRWLMGRPLSISDKILRIWRTGSCRFTDVSVNEHPVVSGNIQRVAGVLEHLDSPDLEHWIEKQNRYSTLEAVSRCSNSTLSDVPRLFGTALQRRMWIKKNIFNITFLYKFLFFYFWIWRGLWKSGSIGYTSAKLWVSVFFIQECKVKEMKHAFDKAK